MSSVNKTVHYGLSQFRDTDKPSWRGDYTGDMAKIDTAMAENKNSAQTAITNANNAVTQAGTVKTTADANKAMLSAMGVNDTTEATEFKNQVNTANSKADSAIKNLTALGAETEVKATALAREVSDNTANVQQVTTQLANKADLSQVYTRTQANSTFETVNAANAAHNAINNDLNSKASSVDLDTATGRIDTIENTYFDKNLFQRININGVTGDNGLYTVSLTQPTGVVADPTVVWSQNHANTDTEKTFFWEIWNVTHSSVTVRPKTSEGTWVSGKHSIRGFLLVAWF